MRGAARKNECNTNIPHRLVRDFCLSLLDELFSALGAGDGDLALATGDADGQAALGAGEIAVVPVFQLVEEPQEFSVLLIPGIGIPGEHPGQGPDHQTVVGKGQHQLHRCHGDEGAKQAHGKGGAEDGQTQLVGAVAAHHKTAKTGGKTI